MQRKEEAVVVCPVELLRGAQLLPDPPAQQGLQQVELTVQLLDFSQVGLLRLLASRTKRSPNRGGLLGIGLPPIACLAHLLQVRDLTGDGQVVKRIVRKGRGEFPMECPLEDSRVQAHLR